MLQFILQRLFINFNWTQTPIRALLFNCRDKAVNIQLCFVHHLANTLTSFTLLRGSLILPRVFPLSHGMGFLKRQAHFMLHGKTCYKVPVQCFKFLFSLDLEITLLPCESVSLVGMSTPKATSSIVWVIGGLYSMLCKQDQCLGWFELLLNKLFWDLPKSEGSFWNSISSCFKIKQHLITLIDL